MRVRAKAHPKVICSEIANCFFGRAARTLHHQETNGDWAIPFGIDARRCESRVGLVNLPERKTARAASKITLFSRVSLELLSSCVTLTA